jgi:2-dehydropantoate 2-reductase
MDEKTHTLNHVPEKRMRHAILGAGAVGGLIGAALAHQGDRVTLLLRPEAYTQYPRHLLVDRPSGNIKASVRHATNLNEPVDVLWVAVKAHQLVAALRAVPADGSGIATIVPLLNGIDHVPVLRSVFNHERVIPGTIAVESERVEPGRIIQRSAFARLTLSAAGERQLGGVAARLRHAGLSCEFQTDEKTMLWSKLAFLAPFALISTAANKTIGEIFADPAWRARLESAAREACAAATADGAFVNQTKILATPIITSNHAKFDAEGRFRSPYAGARRNRQRDRSCRTPQRARHAYNTGTDRGNSTPSE